MHEPVHPRRLIAYLARLGLCAGALLMESVAVTAEGPRSTNSRDAYRDLQLMVHARKVLGSDPTLASLNLGVRVHDGVAILWGAVPSADLIPKAVQRIELVQGILGVRSELYLGAPEKEVDVLPLPLLPEEPTRRESASPNPASGTIDPLLGLSEPSHREFAVTTPPATVDPVPARAAPALIHTAPPATTTSQARDPARTASVAPIALGVEVERLRRSESRFRALRVEVRGDRVFIAGGGSQGEDVMAFARTVSRLSGVARVVTKTDDGPSP
jgi:osmotically-inducible protein OsmY